MATLQDFIPQSLVPIAITLALSFLIGFEREERHRTDAYSFGGVRTFPLIGLCGYMVSSLSPADAIPLGLGFLGLSILLWLSYQKKIQTVASAGMTSEVSALFTYLLGAVVAHGNYWQAVTLTVVALLLLELKTTLERLAKKIPPDEILTFTRFLLMTAVILPLIPNRDFTDFAINPYHVWLVVVAISGISYLAYVLDLLLGQSLGVMMSAAFGGLYSSTVTTVALARRSGDEASANKLAGAILIASGLMYFRLLVLLTIFNAALGRALAIPFIVLGVIGTAAGWMWAKWRPSGNGAHQAIERQNPLELKSAFLFALLFVFMAVLTKLVLLHAGQHGLYVLSFVTGLTDIDPFVMSLSQSAGAATPLLLAAKSVVIASASNDLIKGIYAYAAGRGSLRKQALILLVVLALATFVSLAFV